MSNFITNTAKQTQKLGQNLAEKILSAPKNSGAVILGLQGDLGSGKTTFLQGFAKGLGISEKILSPTFVILKRFPIKRKNRATAVARPSSQRIEGCGSKFTDFYHIDCYRVKNEKDILNLDWRKIVENPENIVAIEWPEKIQKILPKNTISIKFEFIDNKKREIML